MKKIIIFIVNIFFYYLSYLIKKDEKLWLFGAWAGQKYADNSKYFFLYVIKNHKNINAVWITKNKRVYEELKQQNLPVEYAYSLRGYYLSMKAKVVVISNTKLGDVNGFVLNKNTFIIQLWHGSPMKKMGYDVLNNKYNKINKLSILFPYLDNKYKLFLAASKKVIQSLHSAFKVDKNLFYIMGYPRCDQLFLPIDEIVLKGDRNIIYMPTYRETKEDELNLVNNTNWIRFNNFLIQNKIMFYIKLHPQSKLYSFFNDLKLSNIIILNIDDIYTILNQFDLLITDYSSIYFDFLLLDKPVILTPFDLKKYLSEKGMYIDYETILEYKATNWEMVKEYIYSILINKNDEYKKERQKLKLRYNEYIDGNYSQKIFYKIKELLDD